MSTENAICGAHCPPPGSCLVLILVSLVVPPQEYTVNLYVRQTWRDFRLAFDETNRTVTLNYNQLSRIWVPDLFFRNEKRAINHDVTVPNRLLRLSPDGTLLYSQRCVSRAGVGVG